WTNLYVIFACGAILAEFAIIFHFGPSKSSILSRISKNLRLRRAVVLKVANFFFFLGGGGVLSPKFRKTFVPPWCPPGQITGYGPDAPASAGRERVTNGPSGNEIR